MDGGCAAGGCAGGLLNGEVEVWMIDSVFEFLVNDWLRKLFLTNDWLMLVNFG